MNISLAFLEKQPFSVDHRDRFRGETNHIDVHDTAVSCLRRTPSKHLFARKFHLLAIHDYVKIKYCVRILPTMGWENKTARCCIFHSVDL